MNEPCNKLYHYTSLATALEYILPRRKLLLNPLLKTNDPREYKSFVFSARYSESLNLEDLKKTNRQISNVLRADCKVLCFSIDHKDQFGFEYSRMWAHYGGNHMGVCLELDKAQFIDENKKIIDPKLIRPIKYDKLNFDDVISQQKEVDVNRLNMIGLSRYVKEVFRPEHLKYFYFTKNKEWKSEREVRVIHFSEETKNEYCSIQKSLRKIYLGVDFHDSYLPAISKFCNDNSIPIYRMEYTDNVRLTPHQINY